MPDTIYYMYEIVSGFAEINEERIKNLHLELLAGDLSLSDNEIVVSKYLYEYFREFGYKDPVTKEMVAINNYEDLIEKEWNTFTIKGIVDTHFNFSKYQQLKNENEETVDANVEILNEMYRALIVNNSNHNLIFVNDGIHIVMILQNHYLS